MLAVRLILLSATLLTANIEAQTAHPVTSSAAGPAAEVQHSYSVLREHILNAAEKMPAADYSYKPTPDIRTFARVLNHVTEAQMHACHALLGTTMDPKDVPAETAGKDAVVDALKASFQLCDKAYGALTDTTLTETATMGPMKRSHIGIAWGNVSHDNEQYAILSLYLRLKGIAPPTTEH